VAVELATEPLPAVCGENPGDHRGRRFLARGRAHGHAAHEHIAEICDIEPITPCALADVVERQHGGRDDQVVDVLPVAEQRVIACSLDAKIRHRTRRSPYPVPVKHRAR
jgi:hypothetical protein